MEEKPPEVVEPPSPAPFIVGVVVGIPTGGTVLTIISFFAVMGLSSAMGDKYGTLLFILFYLLVAGGTTFAIVKVRRALNFLMGLLIGSGAGLLGGMAICELMTGGLSNMH